MTKGFRQKLAERQQEVNSLVCIGLDPLPEKTPEYMTSGETWIKVIK